MHPRHMGMGSYAKAYGGGRGHTEGIALMGGSSMHECCLSSRLPMQPAS